MKITIVIHNLSGHSGTSKILISLANALKLLGNDIGIVAFKISSDWNNLAGDLDNIEIVEVDHGGLNRISNWIMITLLKKYAPAWSKDEAYPFLSSFVIEKKVKREIVNSDIVISMNPSSLIHLSKKALSRRIVYFHEIINWEDNPFFVKFMLKILKIYIASYHIISLSVTPLIAESIRNTLSLDVKPLPLAFDDYPNFNGPGKYILFDSRWDRNRDPLFALEIIKLLPDKFFIMVGKFTDSEAKLKFDHSIIRENLINRLRVIDNIREEDLRSLYHGAFVFMRWSALTGESGMGMGVVTAISTGCIPIVDYGLGSANFISTSISSDLVVGRSPQEFAKAVRKLEDCNENISVIRKRLGVLRDSNSYRRYALKLLSLAEASDETTG